MDTANYGVGMTKDNRMNCNMLLRYKGQKALIDGIFNTS